MKGNEAVANRIAQFTFAFSLLVLTALVLSQAVAAAPPRLLAQLCEQGSAGGQCQFPRAVAVSPVSGDVYELDASRINQFNPWGQFIRAFGSGVLNGGASGVGTLTAGSTRVDPISLNSKAFVAGMAIEGTGIASGTTVASVGSGVLFLSQAATKAATGEPTSLTSPEAPGNVPVNELQTLTVTATGGTYELSFAPPSPDASSPASTSPIPYNASPSEVQSALEGLATIGAGNVSVTSANAGGGTGAPGGPYRVEFKGSRFSDTNVEFLRFAESSSSLTGGGAEVTPLREGASGAEVCAGTDCRQGVEGHGVGQLWAPSGLTVDSHGDLYVEEPSNGSVSVPCTGSISCGEGSGTVRTGNNRVQKFDPDGNFMLMFGGGVDEGGGTPSHPGNLCTAEYSADGDTCGAGNRGSGPGEFGISNQNKPLNDEPAANHIAAGPDDTVYVGGLERIQEFHPDGTFKGMLPDPDGALEGKDVFALAADESSGDLYASFAAGDSSAEPGVLKLSPSGEVLGNVSVSRPQALATDTSGNLYVIDGEKTSSVEIKVRKFSAAGVEDSGFVFSDPLLAASTGIAASSACGIPGVDIFIASHPNFGRAEDPSIVRAYGPPPNPAACPPPSVPPTIDAQFTNSVYATGATLQAKINPHFWPDTHYYLEYGTGKCSEGECDQQRPLPPGELLTAETVGESIVTPAIFLDGLNPDTTYHYRFVAQSSGGGPVYGLGGEGSEGAFTTFPLASEAKTDCPNQAFRFGASAALPDCRAYEMVSPVEKNGGDAVAKFGGDNDAGLNTAAIDGERFAFASLRSFADPKAAPLFIQYLSSRGPEGWTTRSISPPRSATAFFSPGGAGQFKAFSTNLCEAWLLQDSSYPLVEGAPTTAPNLYRANYCGEGGSEAGYELLTTTEPPGFDFAEETPETTYIPNPQGHSADGTHTVFRADAKLPSSPTACSKESPPTRGTVEQLYETSLEGPLRLISVLPNGKANCEGASVGRFNLNEDGFSHSQVYHAVSEDGSRVFWSISPSPRANAESPLFVRINATQPQSKVSGGKCTEPEMACTLPISGSNAFFRGADPQGQTAFYTVGQELFEFDVEADESHLIATKVEGVAGMSNDASRVYFGSSSVLSGTQQNSFGEKPQAGVDNLYLYEDLEGSPSFTFIGGLGSASSSLSEDPHHHTSRVTADGGAIAFISDSPLNGYDNTDLHSGQRDMEVYVYRAGEGGGELSCVSCNPSGARPIGRGLRLEGLNKFWTASYIPGWPGQLNPSHLLSNNGKRLVFQSFDALVPTDTNGKEDVYEWGAAENAQDCREDGAQLSIPGGCIGLISTGKSPEDSEVLDASEDGRDVFFETASSLLPQDPGLVDVYDARAGGGFPPPAVPAPSCEGEACQGPLAPPNDPTPGSSSFEGAGNLVQKPAKKAHKKKHAKKKHAKKKQANKKWRAGR